VGFDDGLDVSPASDGEMLGENDGSVVGECEGAGEGESEGEEEGEVVGSSVLGAAVCSTQMLPSFGGAPQLLKMDSSTVLKKVSFSCWNMRVCPTRQPEGRNQTDTESSTTNIKQEATGTKVGAERGR